MYNVKFMTPPLQSSRQICTKNFKTCTKTWMTLKNLQFAMFLRIIENIKHGYRLMNRGVGIII